MPKNGTRLEKMDAYPIAREKDYLYYVDGQGYVWKSPRAYIIKRQASVAVSPSV